MTTSDNKEVISRFIEAWNRRDLDRVFGFWDPEVVHHARFTEHRLEDIKIIYATFMNAFPDLHFDIEDMIAEGDKVVTRLTANATHQGQFIGMAPTGKHVRCTLIDIARIADDKIVEHWGLTDELHLMEQIDLIPTQYLSAMS
jgi:steroid delta-isomerase-like uncharacterized protein